MGLRNAYLAEMMVDNAQKAAEKLDFLAETSKTGNEALCKHALGFFVGFEALSFRSVALHVDLSYRRGQLPLPSACQNYSRSQRPFSFLVHDRKAESPFFARNSHKARSICHTM
jgi:hypothetical protein